MAGAGCSPQRVRAQPRPALSHPPRPFLRVEFGTAVGELRTMNEASQLLLALTPDQQRFFNENGYLLLEQVYTPDEVAEARAEMRRLLRDPEQAHPRLRFSYEDPAALAGQPTDPDNPRGVWMVMDTPLAGDWWFRQILDPRVVDAMVDCLGPDLPRATAPWTSGATAAPSPTSPSAAAASRSGSERG